MGILCVGGAAWNFGWDRATRFRFVVELDMRYRIQCNGRTLRTGDVNEYAALRQLVSEGYDVYKRGWPDFVALKDGKARFIEMKGPYGKMRKDQLCISEILRRAGCAVEVWKKEAGKG